MKLHHRNCPTLALVTLLALTATGCGAFSTSIRTSETIHAPAELVWDVLTDLRSYPAWEEGYRQVNRAVRVRSEAAWWRARAPHAARDAGREAGGSGSGRST